MRLRTSFRVNVAASSATIVALALAMAWSARVAGRAREELELAVTLQRDILERAELRSEYLLLGTERIRRQWEEKSAVLAERLQRAGEVFDAPADRAVIAEMASLVERGAPLFREIVALSGPTDAFGAELRRRLTSKLVLLVYDLSARASSLVESASAQAAEAAWLTNAFVFLLVVAVLAVVATNAVMASRLLARRIARLVEGAERITAGAFGHRIGMKGDDELADLGSAFDRMAAELERHVAKLEASNRELEAFSYSVSHDLRAPLRHVTGFVKLLEDRARPSLDEKSVHYLRVIADAARNMGRLIDDLLAFSRMSRTEMISGRVELRKLVDEVIEGLREESGDRAVSWRIGELPAVRGDAAMLRQVWHNLVANALKFSRPRAEACIEIGAREQDGEVRCWVCDNGVGFDMKYADKLFGVFQRLHRADEFEGTGVGLATVQRIVHRHGGRVWAEAAPDRGATFSFSLPSLKEEPT